MARRAFTEGTWRKNPWFRALCTAIVACKNEEEVASFLRDVGTLTELQAWSERFEVAKQIAKGRTYRTITDTTGASTTTVTRVARFLTGDQGGYRRALNVDLIYVGYQPTIVPQSGHHHRTTNNHRVERTASTS